MKTNYTLIKTLIYLVLLLLIFCLIGLTYITSKFGVDISKTIHVQNFTFCKQNMIAGYDPIERVTYENKNSLYLCAGLRTDGKQAPVSIYIYKQPHSKSILVLPNPPQYFSSGDFVIEIPIDTIKAKGVYRAEIIYQRKILAVAYLTIWSEPKVKYKNDIVKP